MSEVSMPTKLNVTTDQVWGLTGSFNALSDWHPAIEKRDLEEEGQMRHLCLTSGGTAIEKQERIN